MRQETGDRNLEPPVLTLALTPACLDRLQRIVARHNADNPSTEGSLTLLDWLHQHLRELAIQGELMEAAERLQRQAQTDALAAIQAEKQRLLDQVTSDK